MENKTTTKGEMTVNLLGKDRRLKLTLESIDRMETESGQGILTMGMRAGQKNFLLRDMASLFLAGIWGLEPDDKTTVKEIMAWIHENKLFVKLMPAYCNFIFPAITAGPEENPSTGEAQAQATKG